MDRWILGRLQNAIDEVTNSLDQFKYTQACKALYDFVWHDFCDWYLEMVKSRLREHHETEDKQRAREVYEQEKQADSSTYTHPRRPSQSILSVAK